MAMEFTITINNLKCFIRMCHSAFFSEPYAGASASQWLINYWNVIDKANVLLWHDTSEYQDTDVPQDEARIITNQIKEEFKQQFTTAQHQGGDITVWRDSEAFANRFYTIWLDFVPGWKDANREYRYRGKELEYYLNRPCRLNIDFIASIMDMMRESIIFQGVTHDNIISFIQQFGRIIFRNPRAGDACVNIFSEFDDIDESIVDEFWGNEEKILSILHNTSGNRDLDDHIYQMMSAVSNMMITDSMIATASFKLGEYISTKEKGAESVKMDIMNPETGKVEEVEGTLDLGEGMESVVSSHNIIEISLSNIETIADEAIETAEGDFDESEIDHFCNEFDADADPASYACQQAANGIFGKDNGKADVYAKYLFKSFLADIENGDDETLDEMMLTEYVHNILPSTMVMEIKQNRVWRLDLTRIHYICTILDEQYRKMISTCYITRKMDNGVANVDGNFLIDGTEYRSVEDIERHCGQIIASMLNVAFNMPNIDILVNVLINEAEIDVINPAPGDIANIVMEYCIPPLYNVIYHEERDTLTLRPEFNFSGIKTTEKVLHYAQLANREETSDVLPPKEKIIEDQPTMEHATIEVKVPHVMLTISKEKLHEIVDTAVKKANGELTVLRGKDIETSMDEIKSRIYDPQRGLVARSVHYTAGLIYGHNSLITNAQMDAIAHYIFQGLQIVYSTATDEKEPDLTASIEKVILDVIPKTMVHKIEGETKWTYDLDYFRLISSLLSGYYRDMISHCYVTREMDNENFPDRHTYNDWKRDATDMFISMVNMAFNNSAINLLVEVLVDDNCIDPLNLAPAELGWIIMNICLPEKLGEVYEDEHPTPDLHPLVNFPQMGDIPGSAKDMEANKSPDKDYIHRTFVYHLETTNVEQMVFAPENLRSVLKFLDAKKKNLGERTLTQVGRFIYPHSTKSKYTKQSIISSMESIYGLLKNSYYRKSKAYNSSVMVGVIEAIAPTCGFPAIHLPSAMDDSNSTLSYKITVEELNSIQDAIMRHIYDIYGENDQMMGTNPRPLHDICNILMQFAYPVANFVGAKWTTTDGENGGKVILEEITKLVRNMMKAELLDIDARRRERLGDDNIHLTPDCMTSEENIDLAQHGVSDENIATAVFFTMVHLCPFDDIMMSIEEEKADEPKMKDPG